MQPMNIPDQYLPCKEVLMTYANGSARKVYYSDWEGGLKFEVQHLTPCKVLRWKNNEQRTSNSGLRSGW